MSNTIAKKEATSSASGKGELTLFESLHKEMNRLFEDFIAGVHLPETKWREPMTPFQAKVDVKDNANELLITAEPSVSIIGETQTALNLV